MAGTTTQAVDLSCRAALHLEETDRYCRSVLDPRDRPRLRLRAMLEALHRHNVDWVMSGSVVLAVYGADVQPNDLDVVPSPAPDNLQRIADLLVELEAVPAYDPSWRNGLTEAQCRSWQPEPVTLEQLDHLFVTRLGMLDVPPELTGTYAHLRTGATELELAGTPVWVCDPREVLKRVPDPPRPKDLARADAYAELRQRLQNDSSPTRVRPICLSPIRMLFDQ